MINRLSETIATRIKQINPEETASIEVMKFALVSIMQHVITLCLIFLIGAATGHVIDACIVNVSFILLRLFSGGFHLQSSALCILVSTLAVAPIPLVAEYVSPQLALILTIASFAIIAVFAPTNVKRTRIKPSQHPIYKLISLLIVSVNFIINSPLIATAFLVQAISTIQIKGGSQHGKAIS